MNVIVVGCGPAGLAAAHAASGLGASIEIIAPKKMTPQEGPLLIQRPIPGINTDHPDGTIHQVVIGGSILDYRYKLYGDINIGINGDQLKPHYHAWRHNETYQKLWDMYENAVLDYKLTTREMRHIHEQADLVVSTASSRSMCTLDHKFLYKEVVVTSDYSYPDQPDNTIIFNACTEDIFPDTYPSELYGRDARWVRSSRIFGVPVTEWPFCKEPADRPSRLIRKPIGTDCNCYPQILRTGRFGAWKNEVWCDTAYWDTYNAIVSMNSRHIRSIGDITD
jgi:hypothetical protein